MDVLLIRLEAPLMSFGGPMVDKLGVIQPYPALSMVTGLLGNALGLDHADFDKLENLQDRIRYACREDRSGERLTDFQTVDLSQPFLQNDVAWTTRNRTEGRKGGSASHGTHIRLRDYLADGSFTLALTLDPADEDPTLDDIESSLDRPARPLFIGRKPCIPSTRLAAGRVKAESLLEALKAESPHGLSGPSGLARVWSEVEPGSSITSRPVVDRRDWRNQIHVGERWVDITTISPSEDQGDDD